MMNALILSLSFIPVSQVGSVPVEKRQAVYQLFCAGRDIAYMTWLANQPQKDQTDWGSASPEVQTDAKALWVGLSQEKICDAIRPFLAKANPPIPLTTQEIREIVQEGRDKHWPERSSDTPSPTPAPTPPTAPSRYSSAPSPSYTPQSTDDISRWDAYMERRREDERKRTTQGWKPEVSKTAITRVETKLKMAQNLEKVSKIPAALGFYREVIKDHPDTPQAKTAAERSKALTKK